LSIIWSSRYDSNNGTIWSLFYNLGSANPTWSWANITDWTISSDKLDFKNAKCLDSNNQIVWMKTLTGWNVYTECTSTEWWTRVVY